MSENFYLKRYTRFNKQITLKPGKGTHIIITIPCYNEPNPIQTLESLLACDKPTCPVEVIILVNHSEKEETKIKEWNEKIYKTLIQWCDKKNQTNLHFYPLFFQNLKPKIAGVGTARKIAMDEAVYRFEQCSNHEGVIVCLDADCEVSNNYLVEIEKHFQHPGYDSCVIYFEHPLNNLEEKIRQGIVEYELYLRVHKNALLWSSFPYAFHTIGSTICVRSRVYQEVSGMNKRKAGEDFYFLQKLIHKGRFSELNSATVYPSPRPSKRVPFGTGKAISDYLEKNKPVLSYHPQIYVDLKIFLKTVNQLYSLVPAEVETYYNTIPQQVANFLGNNDFPYYLGECQEHSTSYKSFRKRFFHWFDAFQCLKYIHHARDHFFPSVSIDEGSNWLLKEFGFDSGETLLEKLQIFRELDRKG